MPEISVDDLVAAEDKVAIRVSFRGTHQGKFQGIPATGRTIHYVSHEFYRVENGLFAEVDLFRHRRPSSVS